MAWVWPGLSLGIAGSELMRGEGDSRPPEGGDGTPLRRRAQPVIDGGPKSLLVSPRGPRALGGGVALGDSRPRHALPSIALTRQLDPTHYFE